MLFFKDFHQLSQNLLLWLASAEKRRQKAHVTDPKADRQVLLERQKELLVSSPRGPPCDHWLLAAPGTRAVYSLTQCSGYHKWWL
jgi:hypothetical protein